jgi:hypothetical protein
MISFLKNLYQICFSRTLEQRLGQAMTANGTKNWVSELQKCTLAYNNTYNPAIKMTPNQVTSENEAAVFDYLEYKKSLVPRKTKTKYKIGDIVRIPIDPNNKKVFKKGYTPNWTKEFYIIKEINFGDKVPTFNIKSEDGDVLPRRFYEQELNFVMTNAEFEEERKIANSVK